jgi:hypothetical protein
MRYMIPAMVTLDRLPPARDYIDTLDRASRAWAARNPPLVLKNAHALLPPAQLDLRLQSLVDSLQVPARVPPSGGEP